MYEVGRGFFNKITKIIIPRNLLLDDLLGCLVGFSEEVEQYTREIVGVVVGIAQLVGDGIEEQIATLWVKLDC